MIGNNLIYASSTGSYSQYQAPPNYLRGTGNTEIGQLGIDVAGNRFNQIGSSTNWLISSIYTDHTLVVKTDGTLWSWGNNSYGQLGDGTTTVRSSPVQIGTLTTWDSVSSGKYFSMAIKNDGTLWGWGLNSFYYRLGLGNDSANKSSPVQIGSLTDWKQVAASDGHVMAVKTDGTLWGWGSSWFGQIGTGDQSGVTYSSPVQVGSDYDWDQVSAFSDGAIYGHTMAIKTDGTLWGMGNGMNGQLGTTTNYYYSPIQIGSDYDWLKVSCGKSFSMSIKTDGTLWGMGRNNLGQLGDGTQISRSSPVQIGSLTTWTDVYAGHGYTIAIKTNGTLWAWGDNSSGQFGNLSRVNTSSPIQIGSLTNWMNASVIRDSTSRVYTTAVNTSGQIYAAGDTNSDEFGDKGVYSTLQTDLKRSSPVQISSVSGISQLDCGINHSSLIKTTGTLWAWGDNSYGQLGTNDLISPVSPIQVGSGTSWKTISCGYYHTMAVKTDGTLWGWGGNTDGKLGSNNLTSYSSPVQIGTLTNWKTVSCGVSHTMAVKTDGTLWGWGDGWYGKLGLNSLTSYSSPVQVGTLTDWNYVSCGANYTMAIKTDGTLWAWGANWIGQLGTNNNTSYSSPVQVGTLTDWKEVCANMTITNDVYGHTLAVKTDGTLWAWGQNWTGQLGTNNNTSYSSPVQVGTLTNWQNISLGLSHTIAVKTDRTLWGWGLNTNGQLGDGTIINKSSPVQISSTYTWASGSAGNDFSIFIQD